MKGLLKLPIYVVAAVILVPCIILNLAISLIPLLIFLAINKNIANDKKNSVIVESDSEYNKLIEEKSAKLIHDEHSLPTEEYEDNTILVNGHKPSQVVQVISRSTNSEVDQTTVISGINDRNIKDGRAMVRVIGNDSNVTMKGIITGNMRDHSEAASSAFVFGCQIVPDGLDFQLDYKMRIGNTQVEATKKLMQNESVQTMLSGDSGILAVENVVLPCASIKKV